MTLHINTQKLTSKPKTQIKSKIKYSPEIQAISELMSENQADREYLLDHPEYLISALKSTVFNYSPIPLLVENLKKKQEDQQELMGTESEYAEE